MNSTLAGILVYIVVQLIIGFLVSKKIRNEEDYLLAGRSLGYGLAIFSIFATWFGAESCIGTAGAAYELGLAGVTADPFGYAVCLIVMALVLAVPLWKMKLTTIADLFKIRFSQRTERLTAIIMIPTSLLWAAAQIRALGMILSASSELTATMAITLAAAVVIVYTVMGGLLADAITDVVQGVALIAGLVILIPIVMTSDTVTAIPDLFVFRDSATVHSWWSSLEEWAIPICGSLVAQELISRVIACRSPQIAKRSTLLAAGMYLVVGIIPLTLGLAGFYLIPGLEEPEHVLPMIAQKYLPSWMYVLFAGAIVSAILSTVDSALLSCSALFSHNILLSMKPGVAEKQKLLYNRLGVVGMGILAYILALHAEGVYNLVKDASSLGSAGIFVVAMFGVFTRFGKEKSAITALLLGVVVWMVASYGYEFELSYLLALAVSFAGYIIVASFENGKPA
ncbi:sodium:solute symporter family protein [bacterium]|nr:sodium:solute symporter family protein [bacterium]